MASTNSVDSGKPGGRSRALNGGLLLVLLVALAVLTACKTTDDQAPQPPERTTRAESPLPEAEKRQQDPLRGVEETVSLESARPELLRQSRPSSSEFYSEPLEISAAPSLVAENTSHDRYDRFAETGFVAVRERPLSTFSIDVDTASYSNLRRFIQEGTQPPRGAIRIEEMLNYFRYSNEVPERAASDERPIAVDTELFVSPWKPDHRLIRVAISGRSLAVEDLPARNLVLLVDVS